MYVLVTCVYISLLGVVTKMSCLNDFLYLGYCQYLVCIKILFRIPDIKLKVFPCIKKSASFMTLVIHDMCLFQVRIQGHHWLHLLFTQLHEPSRRAGSNGRELVPRKQGPGMPPSTYPIRPFPSVCGVWDASAVSGHRDNSQRRRPQALVFILTRSYRHGGCPGQ